MARLALAAKKAPGPRFPRLDGSVWTTDKDGIVPALLAAEITARMGRDPGEIYRELTREFGEPVYDRVEAPATPEQKELLAKLSPQQVKLTELAGEKIQTVLTNAPGNGAPIGGLKVVAEERMVRGASVRDREISTRFMRRVSRERIICAASWRKPRQLSTMLWQRHHESRRLRPSQTK